MLINLVDIAPGTPVEDSALTWVFVAIFTLPILAFIIAVYVMHSLGLYTTAKRRGIHHPWLAWLPMGQDWLLGSISDQFQCVTQGKVRHNRKILLALSIPVQTIGFLLYIYLIIIMPQSFSNPNLLPFFASFEQGSAVITAVLYILSLSLMVFRFISIYHLFFAAIPQRRILFLILSILIEQASSILIFAVRNRDDGMPPRIIPQTP